MSPLQSWAPELRNLAEQTKKDKCDITIDSPTYIMKIDASVNMYHHFCDFFNLYSSQHLNATIRFPDYNQNQFSTNNQIVIWENLPYRSAFASAFEAFTSHPIWNLDTLAGKQVCFKDVVFPLLPRMIYGLYYNTPLSPEGEVCSGSGLFRAFSEHVAYRMGLPPPTSHSGLIRVTIMHRLTTHRQILNLDELVDTLKGTGLYEVKVAQFTHGRPTFREQMEVVREQTDILVGIHGAGLTHLLFLPNWAAVFELYHCDDPSCYRDLARLRGVKHVAWTDESLVYHYEADGENIKKGDRDRPAYSKFRNYKFDRFEFLRKIQEAERHVRSHPDFKSKEQYDINSHNGPKYEKESLYNNNKINVDIKSTQINDEL
jgi:protein O-GlcNAc transferase